MEQATKTVARVRRILRLMKRLEQVKPLYGKLDDLTLSLLNKKIPETIRFDGEVVELKLVDNFAEKNTAYKTTGVKRFELKVKKIKKG